MDETNVFIELADKVLLTVPLVGHFRVNAVLGGCTLDSYQERVSSETWEKISMNNFDPIALYMVKNEMIQLQGQDIYFLTEQGKAIKGKGGIKQYEIYINNKDNAIFENIKLSQRAAVAAEESVKISLHSSKVGKNTFYVIFFYTLITLGILITSIFTCNYQRKQTQTMNARSQTDTNTNKMKDSIR